MEARKKPWKDPTAVGYGTVFMACLGISYIEWSYE